jgi:HemY protein
VRVLFWFLLLAMAAVVAALAAKLNSGYALLVAPPYRVELSLNLLLLILATGFFLLYLVIRIVVRTVRMPQQVRVWRRRQKFEQARSKQDAAIVALLEGRYGKAQQHAQEALALPGSAGLNVMIAARAAIEVRDYDGAETLLARPEAQASSLDVPRLMLGAEIALEQGRAQDALQRLQALRKEAGMHTAALRLELRALHAARRWADVPPLLDQLVKRKVFDAAQAEHVRVTTQCEQLKALAYDAVGLREFWNNLPEASRLHPAIARAASRSFLRLGGDRDAAQILANSLEREWDSELVDLYGQCHLSDTTRQLEQAERWLTRHNQDAVLLRVLGKLCERAQLWGKAQTYFEASLALESGWRAHLALGEMLGRLGRDDEANAHLVAALKLATGELEQAQRS